MAGRTTTVAFLGNSADLDRVADRVAAKLRATTTIAEESNAKVAASAEIAGKKFGDSFNAGTDRAAGGIHKLSSLAAGFGVPFTGALDNVGKKFDEATVKSTKFAGALAAVGKVTLGAGLAGFAAAAFEGVKGAMALQSQMEKIHTQAGATQAEVNKMTGAVENMAGSVAIGPQALAEGLYHVESAGIRGAEALKILRVAAEGAKVGGANLTDVTNALDAAVVSGISGVQNYRQAMGALNATVGAGDMTMQDLADAMSTGVLAKAKTMGLSIRDVGAALALFGDNNIRGADAATKFGQAILGMATPTAAAAKWLKAIGMSSLQMADDMRSGGLRKAVEDLKTHLQASGATASQQTDVIANVFGRRAQTGVLLMMEQLDRLKQKYQATGTGANTFASSVTATHHTLAFQLDQLKATVQALADKFGNFLIPKLQATGVAIQSVIGWMGKHKTAAEVLGATIAGVLGLAITVFAYTKAVQFVGATKSMIGGIGSLVSGIGTAAQAIAVKFGLMSTAAEATAVKMATTEEGMVATADTTAAGIGGALGTAGILGALGLVAVTASSVANKYGQALDQMAGVTEQDSQRITNALDAAGSTLGNFLHGILRDIPILNAAAGLVVGGGGGGGSSGMAATPTGAGGLSATALLNPGSLTGSGGGGGATGPGGPWVGAGGQVTPTSFAASVLSRLGIKSTPQNIKDFTAWEQQEGGNWANSARFNPLNTTMGAPGARSINSVGVRAYTSWAQGLAETVATLKQSNMAGIVAALAGNASPGAFSAAVAGSPWGTGGVTAPGVSTTSAALQALLSGTGGKGHAGRAIRSLLYANPLPGMTSVGRTDMGVDFSATPGSAVNAIGAGVIDKIIGNWYKGQPLVEERLTSGPNAGKFVYYAEQLHALVQQGQRVQAGQRIGTVAASGTGLELGFGAGGGRTLAQATTGYIEGQQTPAGRAFLQFFRSIGSGVFQTTHGGVTTGGGQNIAATLAQMIQAFTTAIRNQAESLITKYGSLEQSGTVRTLTSVLGVSTGGRTTRRLHGLIEHIPAGASIHQIDMALGGTLTGSADKSPQGKALAALIAELKASGMTGLAKELAAAHGAAIATLSQEMFAEQVTKDAEGLNLTATHLRDLTSMQQNTDAARLNVLKAQDQKVLDAAAAQVTAVRDMTQLVQDRFAAMAQSVEDSMQRAADAAAGVVSGINDQTQIRVDVLGERGLYGLNLVAQKLQVQSDITKSYWDQQINLATLQVDAVTGQWHAAVSNAQLSLDQVTIAEDALVAQAQQADDTVKIAQTARIAAAQAHADAVTLHFDTAVVGPAQIAVDLNATAPKAQQDVFAAVLKRATGLAGVGEGRAGAGLEMITANANAVMQNADQAYAQAQQTAALVIGGAQQTLTIIQGEATLAIDGAKSALTGVQDSASIAEASATSAVEIMKATASTQFAGTGTTVNIYGIPTGNAAAIGDAVDWVARTQLNV